MAPMTRNRGAPVDNATPNRIWAPDELAVQYYSERATPGGLIITEGTPPNLEGNGTPAVPGLWLEDLQAPHWKKVVAAVHARGAYIYVQMYHCGRTALPFFTGYPASVSSSATAFEGDFETRYAPPDETGTPGSGPKMKYRDYPPIALSK
jgi:2,4-dienoyl-CoA reductase-like NADH-dependent reductase (Old Yellow Enzyme family)